MSIKWLCVISGLMAVLAILPWSYTYYQILRWLLFVAATINAYGFFKSKLQVWALAFGAIAFLFNPIFPVYLTRSSWSGIDLIVGIFFFLAAFSTKNNSKI